MARFIYNPPDKLGPRNTLFLERIGTVGRRDWQGRFLCSLCGKEFIALVSSVATGNTQSCGCLRKQTMSKIGKQNKGKSPPNLKYNIGDLIGPNNTEILAFTRKSQNGTRLGIFKCSYCNSSFHADTYNISSGHTSSCGCIKSKGEAKISELLIKLGISFETQKTYKDCVGPGGGLLKFDFCLPDYNLLIEYDGEQHYIARENGYFTEEKLQLIQERDLIKDNYAKNNNYRLIRVPYWEYDNLNTKWLEDLLSDNH